jgi:GTPase
MFNVELKNEFSLAEFKMLPPEVEEGNVEYKLKLLNKSQERLEQLTSQLKWRCFAVNLD